MDLMNRNKQDFFIVFDERFGPMLIQGDEEARMGLEWGAAVYMVTGIQKVSALDLAIRDHQQERDVD